MLIDMKEEKWGGGGGGRNVSGMWGVKKLVGDLGRLSGHVDIVSGLCAPPPHLPAPTCQRTHARIQDHGQAEWSRISLLASLSLSFLICSAVFALPASLGRGGRCHVSRKQCLAYPTLLPAQGGGTQRVSEPPSQPACPPYRPAKNQMVGKDLPCEAASSPSPGVSRKKVGEAAEL